jgi:predicted transcriptional regulator
MEFDTLFCSSKWNIIRELSTEKFSPLELAQRSNTTIANVSQQLRLLEATGLLKKERIQNRDKGKPRMLYSMSNNYAYVISAMNDFAEKRLLELTDYHKVIMRIWFVTDRNSHYFLEKFYWRIEPYMGQIRGLLVRTIGNKIEAIVITHHQDEIKSHLDNTAISNPAGESRDFSVTYYSDDDLKASLESKKILLSDFNVLFDPQGIFAMFKKI